MNVLSELNVRKFWLNALVEPTWENVPPFGASGST